MTRFHCVLCFGTALCAAILPWKAHAESDAAKFAVETKSDRLIIRADGRHVGDFVFADTGILRPHFQNLCAPDGTQVTRRHPPLEGKDATDHAEMHPGLWLAFGDISGEDFWRNKGTIRHDKFTDLPIATDDRVTWSTISTLVARSGNELARLHQQWAVSRDSAAYVLSWSAEFVPLTDGFSFGDQEEMGLGVRVATPITEKNGGRIVSDSGVETAKSTWGRAFKWCDYSGTIGDRRAGVTIIPSPQNFRPCWWHNRDYGVFVANPFGRKALQEGEVSQVEVPKGDSFRLQFMLLLHSSAPNSPYDVPAACRRVLDPAAGMNP